MGRVLLDLAKEVILPVMNKINKKLNLSQKESLKLVKELNITRVAVIPFSNLSEDEIFKRFLNLEQIYKILPRDDAIEILSEFYERLKKVMKKYNKSSKAVDIFFESLIKYHINEELISKYQEEKFFDIDSSRDERIDSMHYTDESKISAKDFIEKEAIDEGIVDELGDILDEYYAISEYEFNEEYLKKYKEIIQKFINIFEYSIEFKDLAYGLEKLLEILNGDILSNENKEFIKMLLDSVMEDLNKFYQTVFVEKSAVDIHYLDASLLANIAQIEIILNQTKGE